MTRRIGGVFLALGLVSAPVAVAQDVGGPQVENGTGAVLRALDKVSGRSRDITLRLDESHALGHLDITLRECRYPVEDPASNAFALLQVHDNREDRSLFSGWMIAASPALNAIDHARYDVWVIRCTTS